VQIRGIGVFLALRLAFIVDAGRRLGDGNRVGTGECVLQPAVEALVKLLLAPFCSLAVLAGLFRVLL
jgi:hypothetical protein